MKSRYSCRRYQQSALSGYLSIPACPTNIRASAQASLPTARLFHPTTHESRLLRTCVLPQSPPASAIRTIVLLADTGLPVRCLRSCASKLAHLCIRRPGLSRQIQPKADAFAFSCSFRPCLRHGLQPFFRCRCPPSTSNQACRGLPTWAPCPGTASALCIAGGDRGAAMSVAYIRHRIQRCQYIRLLK